ncbi:YncE family protein [Terrabacter terrigena]|uniref:YncE family protein n=1 Tax=Terrabacter terrigena TaxID=574718 RepID=A0ABW3MRP9_9MICO
MTRRSLTALPCAATLGVVLLVSACSGPWSSPGLDPAGAAVPSTPTAAATEPSPTRAAAAGATSEAGRKVIPPYARTGAGDLSAKARTARPLVYVPDQMAGLLQTIDPSTYRVVSSRHVPVSPEHVVPSWDLGRLWVNSDKGNALTPIDPRTGAVGRPVAVRDPYNLYFTPDGRYALVMASRSRAIDVRDAHTMALVRSLSVPACAGVNHADFTADLHTFVASCEFSGGLLVVDAAATRVEKVIDLNGVRTPGATPATGPGSMAGPRMGLQKAATAMPQDVRLTPDGRWFMVADMLRNGVWFVDAHTFRLDHFVHTGLGAHGIYPARDASKVYVSNRDAGTITVFDASTDRPATTWTLPGHATPDMGGVSADGSQLWLSGRYSSEVYVIDTGTGRLLHRIRVGAGPHGLLVWPQPGRFSLGHTGNMR